MVAIILWPPVSERAKWVSDGELNRSDKSRKRREGRKTKLIDVGKDGPFVWTRERKVTLLR